MNSKVSFFFYGFMAILCFSCEYTGIYTETEPYLESKAQLIKLGDSMAWAEKDYEDGHWLMEMKDEDITGKGIFWTRVKVFIPEGLPLRNQCAFVGATGSYQAFWDGVHLGDNGVLASETKKEIPGTYLTYFLVPDSLLASGWHVLALRTTKTYKKPSQHSYFVLGDYFSLLRGPLQLSKFMFMFAGAFLLTAIYFFFVFFNAPKEYASLIFAFTCLVFCGLLLMEFVKLFYLYPYPFQRTRMEVIGIFHLLISILIPLYFMIQFSFPWKKIAFGILLLLTAFLQLNYHFYFDWLAARHNMVMWVFSLGIVLYAVWARKKGAPTALVAIVLCCLTLLYTFRWSSVYVKVYDIILFACFFVVVLAMLYVLTIRRRLERLAFEESLVVSERLKNELLKKNIKPHFIMNTLTSLIDWVEESPTEGVKFIHSLAAEFEVLNEMADYKQVPISQEIKLCQNHLQVMSYRKEIKYIWEDEGIEETETIPPAIIHTIIENGLTHSLPGPTGSITFRLTFRKKKDHKEYLVATIGKNRKAEKKSKREGTGLKYIKARLQESYPNNWELHSGETPAGWETLIKIKYS